MRITLAAGCLNQTPLDWDGNQRRILDAIDLARKSDVNLLCLPELSITGYGCEDAFFNDSVRNLAARSLDEIVSKTSDIAVAVGIPIFHDGALHNCAALVSDNQLIGFVPKQFLAGDGIHYEPRWFRPWPRERREAIRWNGREIPFGDYLFEALGLRVGFEICEDAWVTDRPGRTLASRGADLILNPSASHFAFGKFAQRKKFVSEGSRDFSCAYVYSNLCGNESGRAIYDGGGMIAFGGAVRATGSRLFFGDAELTSLSLDIQPKTRKSGETPIPFTLKAGAADRVPPPVESWETSSDIKFEEFIRTVSLGLFDYLRKSRLKGYVVSLSGGADSAAVACLVHSMVQFAWKELGREKFIERCGLATELAEAKTVGEAVNHLLICVYQSTENSSETTRRAAQEVAKAIGARFVELEVDDVFKKYVSMVEEALSRKTCWEKDDISLQNIQARVRSPGAWLIANLNRFLLLSTSNRSEMAVGYATMDGDTSGGLGPLGGIDKAFLRKFLVWLEKKGPAEFGSLPALKYVNEQAPTAELRPSSFQQTDEKDLMPYEILDKIERAFVRDRLSPVEIYEQLTSELRHPSRQVAAWIERFFKLFSRNQWKRERYAPSFHIDDENLDPRTWYRFPILSGGFEKELAELRARVEKET